MLAPELSLTKTFVDIAVSRDVFEDSNLAGDVAAVMLDLSESEAPVLVAAFGRAMSAVSSDLGRWRAMADVAVQLDLFELVPRLLSDVAASFAEPHQIANIAALLGNPQVDGETRASAISALQQYPEAVENLRLLRIRLGEDKPRSELDQILDAQLRPGRHPESTLGRLAPLVYLDSEMAPPAEYWRVAGALIAVGAKVRRTSPEFLRSTPKSWVSRHYPFICWTGTAIPRWREMVGADKVKTIMVPASGVSSALALPRLLHQVGQFLPAGSGLHVEASDGPYSLVTSPFSPEALHDGAFDRLEMVYLGGASPSTLRTVAKQGLAPKDADVHRWRFDQLVTLRILQSFRAKGARFNGSPAHLVSRMQEIATRSSTSLVALDANGQIYVDEGEGFAAISGQDVIPDVLRIDDAFRPFTLGGGVVPDMLRPGERTQVDPRVLGGSPAVRDRRISARAIFALHSHRGIDVVRSAYPELKPREIKDALKVGQAIDAVRAAS